ncbi:MAG: aminofutalosine synthase MqnE [Planctomycetota bacterium]|nr:MAG: aminofutalosine synthase MqnE [Planctomycetota bacterium]
MLDLIESKIFNGDRLTFDEGVFLFEKAPLLKVRDLANHVREKKHGDKTYYVVNHHINYSNICILTKVCDFCSFARLKKQEGAYEMSIDEIVSKALEYSQFGATEIHIVGGLHPELPLSWYEEMLTKLQKACPQVNLKCFTGIEIDHFARMEKISVKEVLQKLQFCGLKSLTGGGIEVMSERVRKEICTVKMDADGWLNVARNAHQLGIRSNATLLFGHIETYAERIEHFERLRKLQDETHGFMSFIPLPFHPDGNRMSHLPGPDQEDILKTIAVSRLYLDNFDHIKAYWIVMGETTAQMALSYGANDIDGTVMEEKIYHMAGSQNPQQQAVDKLESLITDVNREPVERDALYNIIKRDEQHNLIT